MVSKRARTSPRAESSPLRTSSRSIETLLAYASAAAVSPDEAPGVSSMAAPSVASRGEDIPLATEATLAAAVTVPAVENDAEQGRSSIVTSTAAVASSNRPPPSPPTVAREHFPSRFSSWDEFDAYLSELCAATYQLFRKRSSVTSVTHNREFVAHSHKQIPLDMFEFYMKRFQCTHGVARRSRGAGLRTHAGVRDTGCAAGINATVKLDRRINAHFIEVRLAGAHNHPVGREQYLGYTENRRITDPVLLRVIETMNARGAPPKEILAQVAVIVLERTGEQCLYLNRDISNALARLKKEREQGGDQQTGDASGEEQSSAEPDSETDSTDTGRRASRRKRRATGMSTANADTEAETTIQLSLLHKKKKPGTRAKLSRLTVFLDSSYCYNHVHNEIMQFDIATMELLPGTVSGFAREVFQLTPAEKPVDVDFVLPRYVLTGCESDILEYCRGQRLYPGNVGVRLSVQDPDSGESRAVALNSRQLMTMKRFHLMRRVVPHIKKVIEWITSTADLEDCEVAGPFDEYADYTKDLFALSLKLLPLPSATVFGSFHTGNAFLQFTDTVLGASILKFGDIESNLDVDCAKAALLGMHSRLGDRASFLKPEYSTDELISENCRKGSAYGAFLTPKPFVAGLVRLQSTRWGAAVLNCPTSTCYLYASKATEFKELDHVMKCLFKGYNMSAVGFVARPLPSSLAESLSPQTNDSGILALLFLELTLQSENWAALASIRSLDYYRMRYMLQAIQVVTKQNIHEIRWP